MCDFSDGFKLCSCDAGSIKYRQPRRYYKKRGKLIEKEDPKNAGIPLEYIWTLYKFDGQKETYERGRYRMPVDEIGKGLEAEWVALYLNCEEAFDFEYEPQEGDNLVLGQNVILGPTISFIYRNGEWEIDHHDSFFTEISQIRKGKIREISDID